MKRLNDPVVDKDEIDEAEYAERVRRLIYAGIESAKREPTVSREAA